MLAGTDEPRIERSRLAPFRYFNSSPEVIRLVVMMYVRFLLSLRNVENLLFERRIDICHETVRMWWTASVRSLPATSGGSG
jgi:putative transposase